MNMNELFDFNTATNTIKVKAIYPDGHRYMIDGGWANRNELYLLAWQRVKVGDTILVLESATEDNSWVVGHGYEDENSIPKKVLAIQYPYIVIESFWRASSPSIILHSDKWLIDVVSKAKPVVGQYVIRKEYDTFGQIVEVHDDGSIDIKDLRIKLVYRNWNYDDFIVVDEKFALATGQACKNENMDKEKIGNITDSENEL